MQGLIQPKTMPMLKGKDVVGITGCVILATKYGGIQRPAKAEPWEAEKLLVCSWYGAQDTPPDRDLDPVDRSEYHQCTLDCPAEPGTVKYYIVLLAHSANPRGLGYSMIAKAHLAQAPAFDRLEDALEAFES